MLRNKATCCSRCDDWYGSVRHGEDTQTQLRPDCQLSLTTMTKSTLWLNRRRSKTGRSGPVSGALKHRNGLLFNSHRNFISSFWLTEWDCVCEFTADLDRELNPSLPSARSISELPPNPQHPHCMRRDHSEIQHCSKNSKGWRIKLKSSHRNKTQHYWHSSNH